MSTLLEISPQSREVPVGEQKIKTYGWSAQAIADLLGNYPKEIRDVAREVKQKVDAGQSIAEIITTADATILDAISHTVIPTAIVWAARMPRDKVKDIIAAEAVVRDLPFTTQLLFLKTAYDLTFPLGVSDFLTALGLVAEAGEESATS
ncbi:hypothetical protein GOC55_13010 [Sinorhizobium medicae]|nr:hypothetical protein [Sinorhizobium medicae]